MVQYMILVSSLFLHHNPTPPVIYPIMFPFMSYNTLGVYTRVAQINPSPYPLPVLKDLLYCMYVDSTQEVLFTLNGFTSSPLYFLFKSVYFLPGEFFTT